MITITKGDTTVTVEDDFAAIEWLGDNLTNETWALMSAPNVRYVPDDIMARLDEAQLYYVTDLINLWIVETPTEVAIYDDDSYREMGDHLAELEGATIHREDAEA